MKEGREREGEKE
jgi:hypothetical protein